MCQHGNTEALYLHPGRWVDIDSCIVDFVTALNEAGIYTVASCCGHGNRPGNIALADGRELIIVPDYESGRKVDAIFPNIHGKEKVNER